MSVEFSLPDTQETQEEQLALPKYQCPICSRRYKRREHLSRHTSSHTAERPHRCSSCNGAFQRADVLKRHHRTCTGGNSRSGARRRACDRCARQKKACSSQDPCQSCTRKGIACHYLLSSENIETPGRNGPLDPIQPARGTNQNEGATSAGMTLPFGITSEDLQAFATNSLEDILSPSGLGQTAPSWLELFGPPSDRILCEDLSTTHGHHSLYFLDRFTSNTGLVASFECGTQDQREQVASALELEALHTNIPEHLISSGLPLDMVPPLVENISDFSTDSCLPLNWLGDPLSLKTHEILLLIEEVVTIKPRNSAVTLDWSAALKNSCLQFFSPRNLRRLLGLYWAIWHPNVNFVHRPTFDPISAKPALLAAMALMGAFMSPDMPDNEDARMWLNCVEEIVFIDDDFNSDLSNRSSGSLAAHRRKIQILQAAFVVCLLQTWEGTDSSKGRIRRYRFATLVSTARDIGIATATHLDYADLARHEFEWKEYAAREELIRVFTWIFLLDTAFVIFNNLPPRLVIKEMKMHMASPEVCFQAPTAAQCHDQIQLHLPAGSLYWSFSLRGAFETLSQNSLPPTMSQALADLGHLNLFALTSAIHSQIFQYRSSVSTWQNLTPIHNTLRNWRSAWQLFSSTAFFSVSPHITVNDQHLDPETMWKRVGFPRFCHEYWLLANLMADRLVALGSLQGTDLAALGEGPLDPILNKYDQTSMRQVNDLIMGFQTFQI
ncbi:hypothetical protein N7476_009041 [Penicillium atrosanguineum]|uniref:Uncharacterized protein n=1 Tax=Penicillium atrosanguineum TaxID=1132637 RepID=A0A9W9PSX5_9EURO|nr:hypothetical protein N7476_009041 [Penicillium atrosanguineum]